ncbi:hypothetical protein ACFWY9_21980 [Amycolatopsis sp. NPDC059027]|uniref:hypothetical protein n=1 Tax=unclassified Amycolatopsis TaxID=2618356 RepID=UPI003671B99D
MTHDGFRLSGVREITETLVDELIRRPGGTHRRLPVVLVLGARGTGKTALLEVIETRCANHLPHALVDLEEMPSARPREILAELAFGLSRKCPQFGRVPFPRLWLCALVTASDLSTPDRRRALDDLAKLLKRDRLVEKHRGELLDVAQLAGQAGGLPGWAPAATDLLLTGLNWLSHKRTLGLIRRMSGPQGDPRDMLVDLRKDAAKNKAVDEMFFDAFLADLRQAYTGTIHRLRRTANCVVLLDNAHTRAARGFLTAMVEARRRGGSGDPVVLLATSRSWNPEWSAEWRRPGTAAEGTRALPLPRTAAEVGRDCRAGPALGPGPWYLISVANLDPGGSREVVGAARPIGSFDVSSFVYRLTGGHPWAVRRVLDVLSRQDEPTRPHRLRLLLSLRPDPEQDVTLAEEAVDYLLQDLDSTNQLEDLTTLSAGRDLEFVADAEILRSRQPDGGSALYRVLVNHLLVTSQTHGNRASLVLDRWLRRVLLHRLAARPEDSPIGWNAVHTRCRDYYAHRGRATDAVYHELALGNVNAAVTHLAGPFKSLDVPFDQDVAERWLADLDLITAAPNRLATDVDPLAQVEELIGEAGTVGPFGLALPRLIGSLWLAGDALGDPANALQGRIAGSYSQLAGHRGQGSILLHDRAERYQA